MPIKKAVWLEKLGLKEFTETVSKYARICSIHFEGEAFEIKPSGKIYLRKVLVPFFLMKEYIPTTETASTSRLDNRKSSTDSTDTAPGTNCSDIIDSFGPPLKRYISYYDCPRNESESLSETLTASETELIQMSITEKETDRPTISQRKNERDDVSICDQNISNQPGDIFTKDIEMTTSTFEQPNHIDNGTEVSLAENLKSTQQENHCLITDLPIDFLTGPIEETDANSKPH
ncbi:hypothetical protein JTB14_036542 [Gonioctena quinquepunctata]|nr:hypothetical protein JTB14_036542 [Gonioctena quinquepunctata]